MPLPKRLDSAGPVVDYLNWLETLSPEMKLRAKAVRAAVIRALSSEDGAILLDLLEKSTVEFALHPLKDPRACDALNAQRHIALDLRRIVSNDGRHHPGADD